MTLLSAQKLRDSLLGQALTGESGVRFHLRSLLGEGGQGWVYRANYDDPEGIGIVVKILRLEGANEDSLRRFEREAKVLQMLGSVPAPNPNIVRFYDHGVYRLSTNVGEMALPFIALELVDGPTLAYVIDQQQGFGLPIGQALLLMKQVARALATVHEHRIVHRDLKPSNILLATVQGQQTAKITDFGLVKMADLSAKTTATVAGATLGYAPPEQYEMGNNRVSPQTDLFSYAAIVFEVLSGQVAFAHKEGDSPLRTIARMLTGDRPQLARFTSTLPRELRARPDLVRAIDVELGRATAADPGQRHSGVFDLWARLEPLLREAMSSDRASGAFADVARGSSDRLSATSRERQLSSPELGSRGAETAASQPRAFSVTGQPLRDDVLVKAAFAPEDGTIYGLGKRAVHAFARGAWTELSLPGLPSADAIKSIARLTNGETLVVGTAGLAIALSRGGGGRRLISPDPEVTWLGAHTDDGDIVLVGERRIERSRTVGVIAEIGARDTLVRNIDGTARLVAVTRTASGTFVACGSHGSLVHVLPASLATSFPGRPAQQEIPWGRTGHLSAICRSFDGGAFAVGTGGHALSIRPPGPQGFGTPLEAILENVHTTRDLHAVALDDRGTPWAGGGQGRLLVRDGERWMRFPADATDSAVIALSMRNHPVFVAEDGTVVEIRGVLGG